MTSCLEPVHKIAYFLRNFQHIKHLTNPYQMHVGVNNWLFLAHFGFFWHFALHGYFEPLGASSFNSNFGLLAPFGSFWYFWLLRYGPLFGTFGSLVLLAFQQILALLLFRHLWLLRHFWRFRHFRLFRPFWLFRLFWLFGTYGLFLKKPISDFLNAFWLLELFGTF